jgi:hypothetical protein
MCGGDNPMWLTTASEGRLWSLWQTERCFPRGEQRQAEKALEGPLRCPRLRCGSAIRVRV